MQQTFPLDALDLDRSILEPLHRQLYHALRGLIQGGSLPAGSKLPSTIWLARLAMNGSTASPR